MHANGKARPVGPLEAAAQAEAQLAQRIEDMAAAVDRFGRDRLTAAKGKLAEAMARLTDRLAVTRRALDDMGDMLVKAICHLTADIAEDVACAGEAAAPARHREPDGEGSDDADPFAQAYGCHPPAKGEATRVVGRRIPVVAGVAS